MSTTSSTLRSSSARLRSSTPANLSSNRPLCQWVSSTVSGPAPAGSVRSTEPGANRSSGESVRTSMLTSPRTPCGRPMRPTTSSTRETLSTVLVDQVDSDAAATQGADHSAQRGGGAAGPADHLAQVVGVHADLEHLAVALVAFPHPDLIRVLDDPAHQVLECLFQHAQLSVSVAAGSAGADSSAGATVSATAAASAATSAGTAASAGASAGTAASAGASAGTAASAGAAAAAGASGASRPVATNSTPPWRTRGSATRSVPSAPGRPLNFCQSPVTLSSAITASVG